MHYTKACIIIIIIIIIIINKLFLKFIYVILFTNKCTSLFC